VKEIDSDELERWCFRKDGVNPFAVRQAAAKDQARLEIFLNSRLAV
jgi:hypothetical protein